MSVTNRCVGTTKAGEPCRFAGWNGTELCVSCAARAGNDEARSVLAARGRNGMASQKAANAAKRVAAIPLRSTDDLLTALERALATTEQSGGDKVQRAKAVCAIVAEARAVLKATELETENRELKALLLEKHPELARHLKAVR